MFVASPDCSLGFFRHARADRRSAASSWLVATATALGLSAATMLLLSPAGPAGSPGAQATITLTAAGIGLAGLGDAAEALRARLLALPGVGAVRLVGLQQAGLDLDYAPARLAGLGVSVADLRRAVAVLPGQDGPGRLVLGRDAAQDGPEGVLNQPVQAGPRVFRLGDVVAVARTRLPEPISRLQRGGRPAVEIVVVPAPGAGGAALDRRVAASLGQATLPPGVALD